MGKKEVTTIDALFGSKTRVKLLHLFLNNPGKAFYVREITRLVDEQINSVRRELANMLNVGVIVSATAENKLYYEINQHYEFYLPFKTIFATTSGKARKSRSSPAGSDTEVYWRSELKAMRSVRLALIAGVLVNGSASNVDVLLVGSLSPGKAAALVKQMEAEEGRELNYTTLSYDEFYYRLSVRDRFITEILAGRYEIIVDRDDVLHGK